LKVYNHEIFDSLASLAARRHITLYI